MIPTVLAAVSLLIWIYLIAARGGFWQATERDDAGPAPRAWPGVIAVIPARDEASGIGRTVESLLRQDYPGAFSIVLEGEIGFRSNDKEVVLGVGGYIVKPRGEVHAMWNAGRVPGFRLIVATT